ncbi:MAG: hypothetical protein CVU02_03125, partial [Bacteroidetes bacterium HGW-Bacteroidetes-19]
MKKNRFYLIVAGVLILASILIVLQQKNVFSSNDEKGFRSSIFAIKDTSKVTKIFMADMRGNKVLLSRT